MTTDPSLAPPLDDTAATPQELFVDSLSMPEDIQEFLSSINPLDFVELLLDSTNRDETPMIAARCVLSTSSTSSAIDSSGDDSNVSDSSNQPNPVIKRDRRCGHRPGAVRNPSRERMQSEIAHLRSQVLNLETQLQSEHEKKALLPIWEHIAKRQLAACERAGKENKRLKSLVELQKELIVSMEGMLYN